MFWHLTRIAFQPQRYVVSRHGPSACIVTVHRTRSPTWHRRLRRQRSTARRFVQGTKFKKRLTDHQGWKLAKAVALLQGHHSQVSFKFSRAQVSAMTRRGGDPSQWYGSTKWNAWSPQYPKMGKGKTRREPEREKKPEAFPGSYDAMPWEPSSSQPSSSATPVDDKSKAFMDAFLKFTKEQDTEIPPIFQEYFKQDTKVELRDQQKKLNQHRAILNKIENKRRAIRKDEEQWSQWLQEVKEMIKKQKARREEQAQKLQEELAALEKKEEELRSGVSETAVPETIELDDDMEEDVDNMLDKLQAKSAMKNQDANPAEAQDAGINQKLMEMKEKMEAEYQQKYELACTEANQYMQQQFQYQLAQMMGAAQAQQQVGEMGATPTRMPVKTGVGPFTRRRSPGSRERSPYSKNQETMQKTLEKSHGQEPPKEE